eukprot:6752695-Prymnesium_polylepis.1
MPAEPTTATPRHAQRGQAQALLRYGVTYAAFGSANQSKGLSKSHMESLCADESSSFALFEVTRSQCTQARSFWIRSQALHDAHTMARALIHDYMLGARSCDGPASWPQCTNGRTQRSCDRTHGAARLPTGAKDK